MVCPTPNVILQNSKIYFKLYTIWQCDLVEKQRNLNENAIRLVFGFAFLRKLHFYNRKKLRFQIATHGNHYKIAFSRCNFSYQQ